MYACENNLVEFNKCCVNLNNLSLNVNRIDISILFINSFYFINSINCTFKRKIRNALIRNKYAEMLKEMEPFCNIFE